MLIRISAYFPLKKKSNYTKSNLFSFACHTQVANIFSSTKNIIKHNKSSVGDSLELGKQPNLKARIE